MANKSNTNVSIPSMPQRARHKRTIPVSGARLDRIFTHPFWGLVTLIFILGITLTLTYSAALPVSNWLYRQLVLALGTALRSALHLSPDWLRSMLVDGILAGTGTVLSFIPILIVFFSILCLLEESGYLARASRVTDSYLRRLGLPGKACIPLSMGFGCNTSAILSCRILEERRARLLTMLLVPFVPCTSRLAVIAFLTPAFFGAAAVWVTWGLISVNLLTLAVIGYMVNRAAGRKWPAVGTYALPPYQIPSLRALLRYTGRNTGEFLAKAGSLILLFSVAIWALSYFPDGYIESSYLARFGRTLAPLGRWAGLDDWRFIVALLSSLVTKENIIAVIGVLFPLAAGSTDLSTQVAMVLSPAARLAFLAIQMLFIPCAGTLAAIRQESGSWKLATAVVGIMLIISLVAGTLVFQIGSGSSMYF
jgi:ferrous iron transport protein B